mmetsp:Transcript_80361/g.167365  ORF Transcript_80361/g.167365 Transcript_80361/m.167365 type:complete len:222 (+) Transcript_80361:977-1642(+)
MTRLPLKSSHRLNVWRSQLPSRRAARRKRVARLPRTTTSMPFWPQRGQRLLQLKNLPLLLLLPQLQPRTMKKTKARERCLPRHSRTEGRRNESARRRRQSKPQWVAEGSMEGVETPRMNQQMSEGNTKRRKRNSRAGPRRREKQRAKQRPKAQSPERLANRWRRCERSERSAKSSRQSKGVSLKKRRRGSEKRRRPSRPPGRRRERPVRRKLLNKKPMEHT